MSLLNFLKTSTVEEAKPGPGGSGGRKQWNPAPTIVAIRVWKDGSVFPSKAAVEKFNLEYPKAKITREPIKLKEGETEQKYRNVYEYPEGVGNGFDVIDSRLWNQFKGEGAMLFIAPVSKDAGKVDLFQGTNYEADGTPKTSVMDQGTVTFGEQVLIQAIEEVYGIRFNRNARKDEEGDIVQLAVTDGVDYVDLAIFESVEEGGESFNVTEHYSKPITFSPKRITRGADKGKADYARRENVKIYGLAPAAQVLPGYQTEAASKPVSGAGSESTEGIVDKAD